MCIVSGKESATHASEKKQKVDNTEKQLNPAPAGKKRKATNSKKQLNPAPVTGNKRKVNNAKKQLDPAPFRLTKDEMRIADKRASEISVPVGFGWKPRPFFSNYSHMKTHDWKEVRILEFYINDVA